jgi:NADPH-dependent 2,4-dienoyl-CoA reductase/sulfur reductase-like enzyme/nitrite reductase/ring-hydroxylating ferredoxin subunit
MGTGSTALRGPDFTQGFRLSDLKDGSMLLGHAQGEAVLLVRRGEEAFAVGAFCTHYGAPLAEGVATGNEIRCPWHHACFDLRSGKPLSPPALDGLATWRIERRDGAVFVTGKNEPETGTVSRAGKETFVIVGAGAAGLVAALTLRREGFDGRLLMIGEDPDAPYDRPNLSKDYLAGTAAEEWIPLRSPDFYVEQKIELMTGTPVVSLDPQGRLVKLGAGQTIEYDKILLATGARPVRLSIPGADLPHVHYLRSLGDSRALIESAKRAHKAVVIGSSFIGLEVAASLRARGLEVSVVGREKLPLERVLGAELGAFVKALHESNGVKFKLERIPAEITRESVILSDGTSLEADLVVIGVGVRPASELAEAAGVAVDRGIRVDRYLETDHAGVFAAGDVARYPEPLTGEAVRIEHWVLAERQAQVAALNMLGRRVPFQAVPFFWSNHYDLAIRFTGYAGLDAKSVMTGSLAERDCLIAYGEAGKFTAAATVGRDRDALIIEEGLEKGDTEVIARIVAQGTGSLAG